MAISYEQWKRSGSSYLTGVNLFKQFGGDQALIDLFETQDEYSEEILDQELRKILPPVEKTSFVKSNNPLPAKPRWQELPEKLLPLSVEVGELSRIINWNRSQLENASSDEERFALAQQIVNALDQRQELYKILNHYTDTGEILLPENKEQKSKEDLVELTREYQNLASRISKAKKKQQLDKVNDLEKRRSELKIKLNL